MNLISFSSRNKHKSFLKKNREAFFILCDMQAKVRAQKKKSSLNDMFKLLLLGGEGGIRTLDALLTHTRVPVVRHKPG